MITSKIWGIVSKYSNKDALKLIRGNLSNGDTNPTNHFKDRLKERKVTMQDVLHIFKTGKIIDPPDLDIKTGEWKYKVEGATLDEKTIAVIVTVEKGCTTLITCIKGKKQ